MHDYYFQVTPFSVSEQWGELDWLHVLTLWEKLTPEMKRVGELVGFEDRFVVRAMKGTINLKSDKQVCILESARPTLIDGVLIAESRFAASKVAGSPSLLHRLSSTRLGERSTYLQSRCQVWLQ